MSFIGPLTRRHATNKMEAKKRLAATKLRGNANVTFKSATAQQAMRTGGWANPSSGTELKYVDAGTPFTLNAGVVTWSAGQQLAIIAPGTSASQRIGRKLTLTKIYLRFSCVLQDTATGGSNVRILIVYDKQTNATAPAITDILLADSFSSPNNLIYRDRFTTLVDHVTDSIGNTFQQSVHGEIIKNIPLEVIYNDVAGGAVGSIASGSVYMFVSSNGGFNAAGADFTGTVRVRFRDA